MTYTFKRTLKKLNNRQFEEDVKNFIKYPYEFYGKNVPEMKTLAKRLHDEQNLKEFYKIFNKLWYSTNPSESSLALYTLELYKEEFDMETWNFIEPKLKDIKSWDHADIIGKEIIGAILVKLPKLEKEIFKLSKTKNLWVRRTCIISSLEPSIKNKTDLAFRMIEEYLYSPEESTKICIGNSLRDLGKEKPEQTKRFILKHIEMPLLTFNIATEKMKELRKVRKLKKLKTDKQGFFWFLKK
jgi:3-methyladenine DNA glycosylase AlkD